MCTLFLCAFLESARLGIVKGFANDQRLRLNTNGKFGRFHRLSPKVTELFEQKEILYVFRGTSFYFVKGYLASKTSMEYDCSVVHGLDWLLCT